MTKQETYAFLREKGIPFEITEHKALFSMKDTPDAELPYPEADAKNLFVRDDKKCCYYLITVRGDKRVDLKEFRRAHGTRPLSFASPEELESFLGLAPGSVTPLGLLHDRERRVVFYMHEDFFTGEGRIGCHPNDNTATVWMRSADLLALIREHGNETHTVPLGAGTRSAPEEQ